MDKIKVKILNPEIIKETKDLMVLGARITQQSHKLKSFEDFEKMYNKPYGDTFLKTINNLPHPTLLHFTKINIIVFGASRRFLAQITRHQDNVKFMSGSLQYSNYSDASDFVVPYNIMNTLEESEYLASCRKSMKDYKDLNENNIPHDECGYCAPQGLRNVLLISATPFELKHMIAQRICRRNTSETRYVMLKIWDELYKIAPDIFNAKTTGCFCMQDKCKEGHFSCKQCIVESTPQDILRKDFPLIYNNQKEVNA